MVFPLTIPECDPARTLGRPKILTFTTVSTGAGETGLRIRQGVGRRLYHIVAAWGYQTSGGARSCYWSFWDGAAMSRMQNVSMNSGVYLYLNRDHLQTSELIPGLDTTRYWRYSWIALGAGENGYMRAIVLQTDCGVK